MLLQPPPPLLGLLSAESLTAGWLLVLLVAILLLLLLLPGRQWRVFATFCLARAAAQAADALIGAHAILRFLSPPACFNQQPVRALSTARTSEPQP